MKRFKKIGILVIVLAVLFTSTLIPVQKAQANPLAIPIGLQGAAGVYTVGALGLAGLVGLAGCEQCQQDIEQHASNVWNGATQLSKDAMDASIALAQGAGTSVVNLSEDLVNWLGEIAMPEMLEYTAGNYTPNGFEEAFISKNGGKSSGDYHTLSMGIERKLTSASILVGGKSYSNVILKMEGKNVSLVSGATVIAERTLQNSMSDTAKRLRDSYGTFNIPMSIALMYMNSLFSNVQLDFTRNDELYETSLYSNAVSKTREAWQDMKDAGMVLPVDAAIPHAGDIPVQYDAQAGTYTGIDGGIYQPGDVTWSFPQPKIRVGNPDIPDGVYVDTPTLTGNPAIDTDIPDIGTTTNVFTGAQTGINIRTGETDIPIEGETPGGSVPPGTWTPPRAKPPTTLGGLVTTKFPFSLPWDLYDIMSTLNADPITPAFDGNFLFDKDGHQIPIKIPVDFSWMDKYIPFFRNFILISFMITLVLWTRTLLGGAK